MKHFHARRAQTPRICDPKWAFLSLLAGCATSPGEFDPARFALTVARTLGDAAIQAKGVAKLNEVGASALVAVLDKQEPFGVLTLAEIEGYVLSATPEEVAALLAAWWLVREAK